MVLLAFVSRVNVFKRRGTWVWGEGMLELIYIYMVSSGFFPFFLLAFDRKGLFQTATFFLMSMYERLMD